MDSHKLTDEERLAKGEILARPIIEMLGTPKEHIEDAMRQFIKKLEQTDNLAIVKKEIANAEPNEDLFTIFAELDIWFKDIPILIDFCFGAMPSSIEIIKPTEFVINAAHLTDLINQVQGRVHEADMIIKSVKAEAKAIDKNAVTIFRNFIRHMLLQGPKSVGEISGPTGIVADEVKPFLDKLIEAKVVALKDDGRYHLLKK